MKSWFDLDKTEQIKLRKEFKSKRRIIDLRIPLYIISVITFIPVFIVLLVQVSGTCYENNCTIGLLKYGSIFLVFITLAIINSVLISKNQQEFKSWLKTRNIEK